MSYSFVMELALMVAWPSTDIVSVKMVVAPAEPVINFRREDMRALSVDSTHAIVKRKKRDGRVALCWIETSRA